MAYLSSQAIDPLTYGRWKATAYQFKRVNFLVSGRNTWIVSSLYANLSFRRY